MLLMRSPFHADGKHRTRATAMAHINPHLPFVPAFLVNFILRVASPFAYRMMSKVSSPGNPNATTLQSMQSG